MLLVWFARHAIEESRLDLLLTEETGSSSLEPRGFRLALTDGESFFENCPFR